MKTVDNTAGTIARFRIGHVGRTRAEKVPGGRRLTSALAVGGQAQGRTHDLISYRTEVATRFVDPITGLVGFALTPRKYSPTTSKVMSQLRRMLTAAGFEPTGETMSVQTTVPGRWGGYGPAWHATGFEVLPFEVWRRPQ